MLREVSSTSALNVNNTQDTTLIGSGVSFQRIRRITGYLVGGLDRFNNAKRCEEHDRVKHTTTN